MDFRGLRGREIEIPDGPARLAELLLAAGKAVAFTGAGISTESGIPDFRSPGGLWSQMAPIDFEDFLSSPALRNEAWRRRFAMEEVFAAARPNSGHTAISELVACRRVSHVITQNIDDLHRISGVPAEKIIELHGNTRYARCLDCRAHAELSPIRDHFEKHGTAPDCANCGGLLKTATISFGQAMPEAEMERAERATRVCDLFLVLGSSLVVYPAAGFPLLAKHNGAKLAIVNRESTALDDAADFVLHAGIGDTLSAALELLGRTP